MKICDYSSLIFTGNTTVLLILALTTDYWEYRTFDRAEILKEVKETAGTRIVLPFDTDSYFQIKIQPNVTATYSYLRYNLWKKESYYHAPLFLVRRYFQDTEMNISDRSALQNETIVELELDLFEQYGNLFRDCDSLEVAVRERIGLSHMRPDKCVYFHDSSESSHIHSDAPELNYLETMASACAMMCIALICMCLVAGAHGLFVRYYRFRAYHIASCSSLIAGFFLTIGIALFHGKCHILQKLEFFPGHLIPFKNVLYRYKVYTYGWSFVLAWICVFFCYIAAYVWLSKAQGCRSEKELRNKTANLYVNGTMPRLNSNVFINFITYRKNGLNRHDIATV